MVDWDLAELYGVETRVMNQAVKRNEDRFPERFRFRLSQQEMDELITNCDKSGRLKHYPGLPYVFTEQGIAMLASVLRFTKMDAGELVLTRIHESVFCFAIILWLMVHYIENRRKKAGRYVRTGVLLAVFCLAELSYNTHFLMNAYHLGGIYIIPYLHLFQKHKEHRCYKTTKGHKMIPLQRLSLKENDSKQRKNCD
jgi:hypothetical protein